MEAMSKWYLGVPRTLFFTLGPLAASETVYLDYWVPHVETPREAVATVISREEGTCSAVVTPAVVGQYRFQPRVVASDLSLVNRGETVDRIVYAPGT